MKRRLAAILELDVVGYSRLMGSDEAGTLEALKADRRDLLNPKANQYGGRVIKLMGDGALLEFSSVVGAVSFAVEVQSSLVGRDGLIYRMGVNIGDVIVEGDDIYGDGVNLAARLKGVADPGGICISKNVHEQVKQKLDLTFEDLGPRELKNITHPVRIYRVVLDEKAKALATPVANIDPRRRRPLAFAIAALCIFVASIAVWQLWSGSPSPVQSGSPLVEQAPVASAEMPADHPSIAVLPFTNMSEDPAQEYFSDGMTEDLITDLSKLDRLSVISRTSSFAFKGREVDIREIDEALNVAYVVEGSVRKVGNQVRINAQLIETATGSHVWAERYDGTMEDIFDLQDEVLGKIVGSLAILLSDEDQERLKWRGTNNVVAHDLYLQGLYRESTFSRDGFEAAMQLYEQALAIDPDYAQPYAQISNILQLSAGNGWSDDVDADLQQAVVLAQKATQLDPSNPGNFWSFGRALARLGTKEGLEGGIEAMQHAIELDPEFADAYAYLGVLYTGSGRAEDGIRSVETAMRLNPDYPFWYLHMRGMARYVSRDFEAALEDFEEESERSPTAPFPRIWLAATYAMLGRQDDAEWQVEEVQMLGFEVNIDTVTLTQPMQDPDYLAIYVEGLRKAGF